MADETDQPPISKLTRSKERWVREGRFLTGKTTRPEEQRLPPGQHMTKAWPVLDLGPPRQIPRMPCLWKATARSGIRFSGTGPRLRRNPRPNLLPTTIA